MDKYQCKQCKKIFSGAGALYTHQKSVHEGVKHACNLCDKQYTTQGDLRRHIESKHGVTIKCYDPKDQATIPAQNPKYQVIIPKGQGPVDPVALKKAAEERDLWNQSVIRDLKTASKPWKKFTDYKLIIPSQQSSSDMNVSAAETTKDKKINVAANHKPIENIEVEPIVDIKTEAEDGVEGTISNAMKETQYHNKALEDRDLWNQSVIRDLEARKEERKSQVVTINYGYGQSLVSSIQTKMAKDPVTVNKHKALEDRDLWNQSVIRDLEARKEERVYCSQCPRSFKYAFRLDMHVKAAHGPPKSKPSPSTIDTCQTLSDSELWTPERVQATWKEEVDRAARKKVEENRKAEEDLERELWNQNVIKDMER